MLSVVQHPDYDAQTVSDDHRFPMRKYAETARLLKERGIVSGTNPFITPEPASYDEIASAHSHDYVRGAFDLTLDRKKVREIGFELHEDVVRRSRLSCAGSILAGRIAMDEGIACNAAGGSHHARRDGGAGFCVFNDVGVAVKTLKAEGVIGRAMVIDCDVHQGDGTADIFADDPDVYTVSVHCETNWPTRKVPSNLDFGLEAGLRDEAYLNALERALDQAFAEFVPDLVYYNAGVDPHEEDRLGKLALSEAGIAARDRYVLKRVREKGYPVVGVMGGGYNTDIDLLARLHSKMFEAASLVK
ncbi:histone deacetylase family protein [Ponticaulis profundi]|uniref:Histone deacetylase n=1 Tax=Ponticaulis profundi TaxID=2665222 RepID=A0ABW1SBU1_9PROT